MPDLQTVKGCTELLKPGRFMSGAGNSRYRVTLAGQGDGGSEGTVGGGPEGDGSLCENVPERATGRGVACHKHAKNTRLTTGMNC